MPSLLLISALLCVSLHGTSAARIPKVARELKLQYSDSYTIAIEPHLFTIATNQSFKSTHLLINSTDENFKSCAIPFEEHSIQRRMEATIIGDKIIVWGIRSKYETDIGDRIEHTILIVDPWLCTFKAVSTFEEERPPGFFTDDNLARIVAYNDSFDVFYPSLRTCTPCRYSIDGKRIDLQYQLEIDPAIPQEISPFTFFRIQSYPARPDGGYIYAHSFEDGKSFVKILDKNFRTVKQRSLDHPASMIAVNPTGRTSNIHVCRMTDIPLELTASKKITCTSFDDDLQVTHTIDLRIPVEHEMEGFSMIVDARGDLFVAVAQYNFQTHYRKFGYYWLTLSYKLIDSAIIYQGEFNGRWRVRGFFADSKYCIENIDDYGWSKERQFVKCVIIPQVDDQAN